MVNREYISLKIEGKREGQSLHPALIDIAEIKEILGDIEDLLFPYVQDRKGQTISYQLKEGSILHKFIVPAVIAIAFQSIINRVIENNDLSILDKKQVAVLEKYQAMAKEKDFHFSLMTSEDSQRQIKINKNTSFKKQETIWVDTEQYIYGDIYSAGGKDNSNIHINTSDFGTLIIKTNKEQTKKAGELLYQEVALLVKAKQNLDTGELKTVVLLDFENPTAQYDETELNAIIERVSPKWKDISVDEWLNEMRGEADA